ncbi:PAS domain S-box protein [Sesbania bispinosa]|nr:PAS domain S-box protein [Sesbania bispinosa]
MVVRRGGVQHNGSEAGWRCVTTRLEWPATEVTVGRWWWSEAGMNGLQWSDTQWLMAFA